MPEISAAAEAMRASEVQAVVNFIKSDLLLRMVSGGGRKSLSCEYSGRRGTMEGCFAYI